jgi:SAM-dependent methyltransferase
MSKAVALSNAAEIAAGDRFEFGANWQAFLDTVDGERIAVAEASLKEMLGCADLAGRTFVDVGSGSGLFSLAAHRLGATVRSFDFDPKSVACTQEMRRRFATDPGSWTVHGGSVLDRRFIDGLGQYDVVYSWGVLHHTGQMWEAIRNAASLVKPGGTLFIAIYNDQGAKSVFWLKVKRLYNRLPGALRPIFVAAIAGVFEMKIALTRLLKGSNPLPFARWANRKRERGMSVWHDWVDWCGGLPFEVATPEGIVGFLRPLGFQPTRSKTVDGLACNEFVFERDSSTRGDA